MVLSFLSDEVATKASEQLLGGLKRVPVDMFGLSFRLERTTADTVNFEFLLTRGPFRYFQPVGYFTTQDPPVILREFEAEYDALRRQMPTLRTAKRLDIQTNALIAAFSIPALSVTRKQADELFMANGMVMEAWMNHKGHPQVCAADEYEVEGPIASFQFSGNQYSFAPVIDFKTQFDSLLKKQLLTIDKML